VRYNLLERWAEADLLPVTERLGVGVICFSPLAQGRLTDRYLEGIPADSRIASGSPFLKAGQLTPEMLSSVRKLNEIAKGRGQTLAQMALSWVLRWPAVTSVLIGASRPEQIAENVAAAGKAGFAKDELDAIEAALAGG
jgi:L-glyceraldehyde 3-phosphate reductase